MDTKNQHGHAFETLTPAQNGYSRPANLTKRVSQAGIVLGVLALLRLLPAAQAVESLVAWVGELGTLAPFAFIGVYLVVTVFMLPASLLSLAAGALFGLFKGTIVVAAGATLGMAATFLIGRYLARPAVERRFARHPRFVAIDRAVGKRGWKIVALLRLSPAVPFNLQNYLYGLTAIRFWPCMLASAVSILPGTFMYVYLGYASRASLGAIGGSDSGRGPGQWALLIAGLVATVAVTIYVTKLARNAIREQTHLGSESPVSEPQTEMNHVPARNPWLGALGNALVAVLILTVAGILQFQPAWTTSLVGPPAVTMNEVYADKADGAAFDHSAFNALLKKYVNGKGGVDYRGLTTDADALHTYVASLAEAPFDELGRDEKLAFLINAYNAFTLDLIVQWMDRDIHSIRDIPSDKRWDDVRWNVAGNIWSLNQIEHEQIRPNFQEPNVHFALVCAAVGCPPLRTEAYAPSRIKEQLADQARKVHANGSRWFQLAPESGVLRLTLLYDWYGGDFEQAAKSVLDYAARYSPELASLLRSGKHPAVEWLEYDWSLNTQENLN